jgi:hypothetical protein
MTLISGVIVLSQNIDKSSKFMELPAVRAGGGMAPPLAEAVPDAIS